MIFGFALLRKEGLVPIHDFVLILELTLQKLLGSK